MTEPESQDESTTRDVAKLADRFLQQRADERDIAIVERQLGRYPRGMVAVGARCACGRPLAVVTRPMLPGGIPFPTTCYLTSPEAVKAVSHIEAEGRMRVYNELLHDDETVAGEYRGAHRLYVAFRHELAVRLRRGGKRPPHLARRCGSGMAKAASPTSARGACPNA